MKGKKIILLFSSTLLLTGCGVGKIKTPKHLVDRETFLESLESLGKTHSMYITDNDSPTYSFVLDVKEESEKTTRTVSGLGKETEEVEDEYSADGSIEFDSSSKIFHGENVEKTEKESKGEKTSSKKKTELQMQTGNGCAVVINKTKGIYAKTEWEDPAKRFDLAAINMIDEFIEIFTDNIEKDSELYVDDNIYTIVNVGTKTESYSSYDEIFSKDYTYQLIVESDSATISIKEDYKKTLLRETETDYIDSSYASTLKFKRKDVSLKNLELSKYAEVKNVSMDFLIY